MSEILQEAFGVESRFYPEYLLSHNETQFVGKAKIL